MSLAARVTTAVVLLAGCSSADSRPDPETTPSPSVPESSASSSPASPSSVSPSPASGAPSSSGPTSQVQELTEQGAELSFGQPATVAFEPTAKKRSVLRLTVRGVKRGKLSDFDGFILDDTYERRASYYYARVTVTNVGTGDVGGAAVPLWGVNAKNVLLPPVSFTTDFARCPSRRLPETFAEGASLRTCLVYLSPDTGGLASVSFRPDKDFVPIAWDGPIQPAATARKPSKAKADR